jgi:hypothetical protein
VNFRNFCCALTQIVHDVNAEGVNSGPSLDHVFALFAHIHTKNMVCRRSVHSQSHNMPSTMDSLTLSRHFLSMMRADDLCVSPCRSVSTRMSASFSARTFKRVSVSGTPYRTKQRPKQEYIQPSEATVASWSDFCTPHPCYFDANHRNMIRPDDASFCQDESNLSFPSMQYPTVTMTKVEAKTLTQVQSTKTQVATTRVIQKRIQNTTMNHHSQNSATMASSSTSATPRTRQRGVSALSAKTRFLWRCQNTSGEN